MRGDRGAARRWSSGRRLDDIAADLGALLAARSPATASCAGSARRRASIHLATAAVVNAVWDLWAKRRGQAAVEAARRPDARAARRAASTSATSPTRSRPARRCELLRGSARRQGGARGRAASATATPPTRPPPAGSATTTTRSGGCAARRVADGLDARQDEGRRATSTTTSAAAALIREEIGPDRRLMIDANQVWDVDEAIERIAALAAFDPCWIEEPTSPDDILGHARDRARRGADRRRHRRALPQPRDVQAVHAGRRDRLLPARRAAGWAASTRCSRCCCWPPSFGVPVCPHAGGVGLCEYVQHLSMFDYIARRRQPRGPRDRVRRPPARAFRATRSIRDGRYLAADARRATASRCTPASLARVRLPGRRRLADLGRFQARRPGTTAIF